MSTEDAKPVNMRAYINLITEVDGLAGALYALAGREGSVIDDLLDAEITADPAQIDAALRAVIRAAQQARKLLATRKAA